jgi:hypothetical protein
MCCLILGRWRKMSDGCLDDGERRRVDNVVFGLLFFGFINLSLILIEKKFQALL